MMRLRRIPIALHHGEPESYWNPKGLEGYCCAWCASGSSQGTHHQVVLAYMERHYPALAKHLRERVPPVVVDS